MESETRDKLYETIAMACRVYGFTTDYTHELIDEVIDSIEKDEQEVG